VKKPGFALSDEELNAYIDGALSARERLEVATYLASHPAEAARSEAFRAQKEGFRALFDYVLDLPIPETQRGLFAGRGWAASSWAGRGFFTLWRRLLGAVPALGAKS